MSEARYIQVHKDICTLAREYYRISHIMLEYIKSLTVTYVLPCASLSYAGILLMQICHDILHLVAILGIDLRTETLILLLYFTKVGFELRMFYYDNNAWPHRL